MRRRPGFLCALWVSLSAVAIADVVYLKNGTMAEGDVQPGSKPGAVRLVIDKGVEVEYAEDDVLRVEKRKSPAVLFDERLRALPGGDIDQLLELARWAEERKLRSRTKELYRRVLELDPNDPVARRELGYVVFRNRWAREEELRSQGGLIQFRGEWMPKEERDRRQGEELNQEIADLFRGVASDNPYIREYSVKKLIEIRDPRSAKAVLAALSDSREAVRVAAFQLLARLVPGSGESVVRAATGSGEKKEKEAEKKGSKKAARVQGDEAPPSISSAEVAAALLRATTSEESPTVRTSFLSALQRMRHRGYFELALKLVQASENALHRERAAEGLLAVLRKDWVPELIRSLASKPPGLGANPPGNPQVRGVLRKIFNEDFQYDAGQWEAWWRANAQRFTDD